jgi:DNA invertase Pin-like site-specific DNA recombinase
MKRHNTAAIYCRLSRDDGAEAESNSIRTQRIMLRRYCKEHGFDIYSEYIDDGISGVTFERNGFKRMLSDMENGKINIIVCKDLSRLGRNNAMVAYYTEIVFPDADIRFICINDGIDSAKGDNEIMGFKSIINEYYARDISKKIKSSNRIRAFAGEFSAAHAPLGYQKSPENKHRLIVEEKGAEITRYIFRMATEGLGTWQIAERLNSENIPTPRQHNNGMLKTTFGGSVWIPSSVRSIIKNRVYLGEVVNGKTYSKSFKNRKRYKTPLEQQIIVPDMHQALISREDFEIAQRIIKNGKRTKNTNIFAGILYCADCGSPMSFTHAPDTKFGGYYMCNKYRSRARENKRMCTFHYLPMDYLNNAVLAAIKLHAQAAAKHENELHLFAREAEKSSPFAVNVRKEILKLTDRRNELDIIILRLFEQNALGKVSDERFVSMSAVYEEEQASLKKRILELELQAKEPKLHTKTIKRYLDIQKLDNGILNELIGRINIHTGEGQGVKRRQLIEIHWRFLRSR